MILPDLSLEQKLWSRGHKLIAGIDEVGRGSWAGPLVAASVMFPIDWQIPQGLADSKMVKPQKRIRLSNILIGQAVAYAIVEVSAARINKVGIGKATQEAFRRVIKTLSPSPDFCLIDAFHIKYFSAKKQAAIKSGDKICASIAAASIIAKVYRDKLMKKLHFKYPEYGFAKHKGYGTVFHQQAIKKFGFLPIHRTSYNLNYLFNG